MSQSFDQDQLRLIAKGALHQQVLRNTINDAMTNNIHGENYVIMSMPGLGKSYEAQAALASLTTPPLVVAGSSSLFAFTKEVALAVYMAAGKPLVILIDDCDILFDSSVVGITKKMFDDTRKLVYGKNARSIKSSCTDLEWQAIESFMSPTKSGFSVPLNNVTFIVLTNRSLATVNEVEAAKEGTPRHTYLTDLHAIRRRVKPKDIAMPTLELWGYVANVVLNEKICEKFMPAIKLKQKEQILTWCYANWPNLTERNLSLVEKMTKDMIKYPKIYLDIWKQEYL